MKILVTGGAGFIGSAVVRQAISDGHQIINVDKLTYAGSLSNVASVEGSKDYNFEKVDICDRAEVDRVFRAHKPDAIMHLAAESHVDRSIDGPAEFIQTNIVGTFTLLEAARSYWEASGRPERFRFHHVSTDEVFGSLGAEGQFSEESRYAPNSPYSASKASSDHLVTAWGETYGLPVVLSNCSNNYGPFHFPEKLIPLVILKALGGEDIPVYGTGENIRDWLFVEDHARALLCVITEGKAGETYTIGGNAERSNLDLVKQLCAILDAEKPSEHCYKDQIKFVADRPGHDMRYAIDASKIKRELGWAPSVTLSDGLRKTVKWYLKNENWWQDILQSRHKAQRLGLSVVT